jgi:hypothetical protein
VYFIIGYFAFSCSFDTRAASSRRVNMGNEKGMETAVAPEVESSPGTIDQERKSSPAGEVKEVRESLITRETLLRPRNVDLLTRSRMQTATKPSVREHTSPSSDHFARVSQLLRYCFYSRILSNKPLLTLIASAPADYAIVYPSGVALILITVALSLAIFLTALVRQKFTVVV